MAVSVLQHHLAAPLPLSQSLPGGAHPEALGTPLSPFVPLTLEEVATVREATNFQVAHIPLQISSALLTPW